VLNYLQPAALIALVSFPPLINEVLVFKGAQYLRYSHLYFHLKSTAKNDAQPFKLLILPVREQSKVCNIGLSDD